MLAPLFAAEPTWTDKEVLIAFGKALAIAVPIVWGLVLLLSRRRGGNPRLVSELRGMVENRDKVVIPGLQHELSSTSNKLVDAETDNAKLKIAAADGAVAAQERDAARAELAAEQNRIQKALSKDGAIWYEKVLSTKLPEFKSLDPTGRRMPIISLLNLKGGVGKTTAAANLGAALAYRGYRVLFLDLDLQGSLTNLYLPDREQEAARDASRLVGDFLDAAFDAEFPNLLDYARPILGFPTKSMVVPTTDAQAYAEMNLTVRWFLRDSKRDPRFLLRKELHLARITGKFDVVLIDCPPLINVSCVNALAACDYVLVPVMPSAQSTARVPVLLHRLREFKENINSELKVMGVFANRTKGPDLTYDERNKLTVLAKNCHDAWGQQVAVFDTFIRQSVEIRDTEDERRALQPADEMFGVYATLAQEVESHLPMFCRPVAPAKAGSGVLS